MLTQTGQPGAAAESGIGIASRALADAADVAAYLKAQLRVADFAQLLVFFSPVHDPEHLAATLDTAFPGVPLCGCSTAGEITPDGLTDGTVVLVGFPAGDFRVVADVIEKIDEPSFERMAVSIGIAGLCPAGGLLRSAPVAFPFALAQGEEQIDL